MFRAIFLVGVGGGIGSVLRYLTTILVTKYFQSLFPFGTFAVNVLGCLIVGLLLGFFERQNLSHPDLKFLFITGFCGGFTTFSAFASENISLFNSGNSSTALIYIGLSIIVSLFAVWLGLSLVKIIVV